ncbi:hypothetical protein [Haemophilus paraphrohaemolyticus]|jgi:membrane protein|uniref:Uncharacterized protein n=1 Tax=Haemophilus paraphrohaemolyticus TaxID=736 RepID=A0A369ZR87_9PAST|nr:hypothetical protein [Haemophilus paraphrohaemolyticus]RDF08490.1 hypothetical protein DPV92_09280 [Haemophilus paraphrohaemolyticus]
MKNIIRYFVTLLIWAFVLYIISNSKERIDILITIITLLSLTLQNLQIKELTDIQNWFASKILLHKFFISSFYIFVSITLTVIFLMPVMLNELPLYLSNFGTLEEWHDLYKMVFITSSTYSVIFYIFSFIGKELDDSTKDSLNRKYGLFYGILLILYITVKFTPIK